LFHCSIVDVVEALADGFLGGPGAVEQALVGVGILDDGCRLAFD